MQEQIKEASSGKETHSEEILASMAATQMPYKITSAGLSDIGLVRQNNEDVWAEVPEIGLYVLADGMGGHQAGEIAARETVNALCRVIKRKITTIKDGTIAEVRELLRHAIVHVNGQIFKMGRSKLELRGMGTTVCCLLFHPEGLVTAHVGDSRIYRLRGMKFEQITKDHSLLCELVDQGQLNEQQVADFLYKNIITKAVGTEPKVEPGVEANRVMVGDIYMMCSDGLSDLLAPEEMAAILTKESTIKRAAQILVATANEKGGRDNITVVIAKVDKADGTKDLSR